MRYYRSKTESDFTRRQYRRPHPDSNIRPEALLARPRTTDTTGLFTVGISERFWPFDEFNLNIRGGDPLVRNKYQRLFSADWTTSTRHKHNTLISRPTRFAQRCFHYIRLKTIKYEDNISERWKLSTHVANRRWLLNCRRRRRHVVCKRYPDG